MLLTAKKQNKKNIYEEEGRSMERVKLYSKTINVTI